MASRVAMVVAGVVAAAVAGTAVVMLVGRPPAPPGASAPAATAGGTPAPVAHPDNDIGRSAMTQAEQLYNRGDAAGAAAAYDKAQTAYHKAGDVRGEAGVAFGLGRMNHGNGQSDKARTQYGRAADLYQQAGDMADQARVLVAMGDLEKDTFHGPLAAKYYRQARDLWAKVPDPKSDPHPILNIDRAPLMPAGEDKARALLAQASKTFGNIGDAEGEGDVFILLATLETNLGNDAPAHTAYQSARNFYFNAGLAGKQGAAQLAIAAGDVRFGYNVIAEADLTEAETVLAGDPVGLARAGVVRGDLERLLGRLELARDAYAAALPALAAAKQPDEPVARLRLSQLQATLDDPAAADASAEAALARFRELGSRAGEAAAQLQLGLLRQAGLPDQAATALAAAADGAHAAGDALVEARALLARGEIAVKQNNAAAAAVALTASAERFTTAKAPFGIVLVGLAKGDAAHSAGDAAGAAAAYGRASEAIKKISEPLAEASRVLGQPPVGHLWLLFDAEERIDGALPDPAVVAAAKAADAANTAKYAGFNPEGRALLAATEARLTAAVGAAK